MKTTFLAKGSLKPTLRHLMNDSDEFHWAVAWGTMNGLGKDFIRHSTKFRNVTFGIAFSQTDPDLIDKLIGVANARVVVRFKDGTYHPKVYGFRSGDAAAAIIGSANFTRGGLSRNHEATILVTGAATDEFFRDLFQFTADSAALGKLISPAFARKYRESCRRAARMPKPPHNPVSLSPSEREPELLDFGPGNRLDEPKARDLVLLIAASLPGRTATTEQLIENAPLFWRPTEGDLERSRTKKNQPKWHQIIRNVTSHSDAADGPFARGLAVRTQKRLTVTEDGVKYLRDHGLRPRKASPAVHGKNNR